MGEERHNSESRMLERRVSNNQDNLSFNQRLNYFLSWFKEWSELQKSDFLQILLHQMSLTSLNFQSYNHIKKGPLSIYGCQIKLFKEWFSGWSDDQKNYLVMRLQAIDGEFYAKYEKYVSDPEAATKGLEKDYFEPGVPPEMVRKSSRSVLGPHSISPTPPAVGYTSNNFSGTSSIESARPATIEERVDSVESDEIGTSSVPGTQNSEESEAQNDLYTLKESKDIDSQESDPLADINYQKQLSTIAE